MKLILHVHISFTYYHKKILIKTYEKAGEKNMNNNVIWRTDSSKVKKEKKVWEMERNKKQKKTAQKRKEKFKSRSMLCVKVAG